MIQLFRMRSIATPVSQWTINRCALTQLHSPWDYGQRLIRLGPVTWTTNQPATACRAIDVSKSSVSSGGLMKTSRRPWFGFRFAWSGLRQFEFAQEVWWYGQLSFVTRYACVLRRWTRRAGFTNVWSINAIVNSRLTSGLWARIRVVSLQSQDQSMYTGVGPSVILVAKPVSSQGHYRCISALHELCSVGSEIRNRFITIGWAKWPGGLSSRCDDQKRKSES